eukprot:TRINITY_DN4160_c2_g1_i2.p1 TRINITY_DN4160_c2_g1~~TRINITY_DN4160_c2_g1_i2.p1  ORF type:complete len:106 (-),score=7.57 TRINITY_DN4160_c2_g1_i2:56-373(-)
MNPLLQASAEGDYERVHSLLENNVDVNTRDKHGFSALHHACGNGQLDVAKLLIHAGADRDARSYEDGITPLFWACDSGFYDVVLFLLQQVCIISTCSSHNALIFI